MRSLILGNAIANFRKIRNLLVLHFDVRKVGHNIYRLLADDLPGFSHSTAVSLFEKFIDNGGQVRIDDDAIMVVLKKKRHVPLLLSALERFQNQPLYWMQNRKIRFIADTSS
ncbi:MAG: hypothetical protein QNJ53_22350 [Pleurocapsa sp. MO_192.B19]|nr:hypothetical protein [Pleurocapsa sp. MO_192.B19]